MDILENYTSTQIQLEPDYEGEVVATLISSDLNQGNRKAVLYIHGYVDYFFQAHLGKAFNKQDYDFYALDLRKYGRSLLEHQHPNYCKSLSEYYEEISLALRQIYEKSNHDVYLMGHSTGGLIASNYMIEGEEKDLVKGLILNSPFFDFNYGDFQKSLIVFAAKVMAAPFDYAKVSGALSPAYAESIHKDYYGEWDFSLDWKPIEGFPTYFAWILAINEAQQKLLEASIDIPVLVMYSNGSAKYSKYTEEAKNKDTVLNVEDIKRVGAELGPKVSLMEIENAVHDIFLSSKKVRESALKQMFDWLNTTFKNT
ncbi:alpha/beta hydrolase [Weeksellaceae bacterium KMM 9713]|uniref:Alpha/beta hydrolase n=1 Tax=Profundicola chukchiensis TaxID=2961959 RepID=A0A9X4MYS4_9FLAO|nr:alpha/beta hydrolase [Profundicola chukchiensis]MDG4945362.1 alpha/beta hydrolase [Profundicola chukchiensis]